MKTKIKMQKKKVFIKEKKWNLHHHQTYHHILWNLNYS
jgi:hypothetical protein